MRTNEYIDEKLLIRAGEIEKMLNGGTFSQGVPCTNRSFWDNVHGIDINDAIARAEEYISQPFPEIDEEIYLNPSHGAADKVLFTSMRRLEQTVIAECLENKGKYTAYISDAINSICDRKSWVRPGHDEAFSYSDYNGVHGQIDLYSSSIAWRLAVCDYCMGDKLSCNLRTRLRQKVKEKIFDVFFARLAEDKIRINGIAPLYWLDAYDNWLSVCLSGVVCAGLYFCRQSEKAVLIALYEKLIPRYIASLPDGFCVEGLAYWGYGFGKFIAASDAIFRATNGMIDLYAQEKFLQAARFGFKIGITGSVYPSVADCGFGTVPLPFCMKYYAMRSGSQYDYEYEALDNDIYILMMMLNADKRIFNTVSDCADDKIRSFFPQQGVVVSRTAELDFGIYIQAGNNHLPHNHNDIGSFIIACDDEAFIADPGFGLYNANTFSRDRYSVDVMSSYGHSVPKVSNKLQGPEYFGAVNTNQNAKTGENSYEEIKFYGKIINTDFSYSTDRVCIDLTHAYDCPELEYLTREMIFDRQNREIYITDSFAFDRVHELETAVITFFNAEIIDLNRVILHSEKNCMTLEYIGDCGMVSIAAVKGGYAGDHDIPIYPLRIAKKVKAKSGKITMHFHM